MKQPQFVISAPSSGAGKTTVARGLMAVLTAHGMKTQPFKCGPDYIDTKFHASVCGRPSINIDTFFCDEKQARALYSRYAKSADAVVVEGMMGLYDGYDRSRGSTADIAAKLHLPVILVVDSHSTAYSMAPLLYGFVNFREDVPIAGVIFNRVGSPRHKAMLQQVANDVGLECFGFLPKTDGCELASRYLGLDFSQETATKQLVELIDKNIDWRHILETTASERHRDDTILLDEQGNERILIAYNKESFSFVYQEYIDTLRRKGQVSFFDPEQDEPIPQDIDMLYLPGGYPEKHAEALAKAGRTRQSIARYAARGGRILAECGGMMYLCRHIVTDDGEYPMCGVLPYDITARKADKHLSLGYRQFELDGRTYKGHEFHYSQFLGDTPPSATQVYDARGVPVTTPVIRQGNVLASYTHLYCNETR